MKTKASKKTLTYEQHYRRLHDAMFQARIKGHCMTTISVVSNGSLSCDCDKCRAGVIVNPWLIIDGKLGRAVGSALTTTCPKNESD